MIHIDNLHFGYRKNKVFEGLNLTLLPGYIYGLLGKNGTGKSTLLRNLMGTLFPDQGSVKVFDFVPGKRQPQFLEQVFLVAEEFYLPGVTAKKFLVSNAPFYPAFDREQFEYYLQTFDIPVNNKLHQMSYGQKKKFLIAFALACNTKILLMDEPTNGLDIISKDQFRKVMREVHLEDRCILISTHQVKDLEELISRITIIDEGKILFDEDIETISQKLSFRLSTGDADMQKAVYREPSPIGTHVVTAADANGNGKVNLELLYKALLSNKLQMQNLFNKTQTS